MEPPIEWTPHNHAPDTKSHKGQCTWSGTCPEKAVWSVHVEDKGGTSWWAVCEEHRAQSSVLSREAPPRGL